MVADPFKDLQVIRAAVSATEICRWTQSGLGVNAVWFRTFLPKASWSCTTSMAHT